MMMRPGQPAEPSIGVMSALVFLGSGIGGLVRYWAGGLIQRWWGPEFPLGTLMVNASGCLVMGVLMTAWATPGGIRDEIKMMVLIGVLGGYTTFSSFGRETLVLANHGQWSRCLVYVGASVILSLGAVWAGAWMAARVLGGPGLRSSA